MRELHITLPWPPTMNTYWRRVGNRTLISKQGRTYRRHVQTMVAFSSAIREPITERMAVDITAYQPDRRARDLDNMLKAPLDALQHSGAYDDDSHIDELRISRAFDKANPRLEITIRTLEAAA